MIEYSSARSYLHLSLKEKNVLFWGLYDSVSILNWNKKVSFPQSKLIKMPPPASNLPLGQMKNFRLQEK